MTQPTSICECTQWARTGISHYPNLKSCDGLSLLTNHHENCPHYNDSLMDVWKETVDGITVYSEHSLVSESETKIKMHREILENLTEFGGF